MTISSKLENFERNVNMCKTSAIEDAADLGENIKEMSTSQNVAFRLLLNKYKNDCYSVKVSQATQEKVESFMGEARKYTTPTGPAIENIKRGAISSIEAAKKAVENIAHKAEIEIRRESERRAAIKKATK